jgi:magnesium transporter
MLSRYQHGRITWIDLENPSSTEVRQVMSEFKLDHFVAEELLLPTQKPRVEFHKEYLYTILHFPALRHTHKTSEQEIDFVVGHNFIITTHYDTVDPLHKFSKIFEVNSVLDKDGTGDHAGYLFFFMLRRLYKAVEHELDYVRTDLVHIEHNLFSGHEVEMVRSISRSAKDLLNLRQTIEPHRDILKALEEGATDFLGREFIPYLRSLENDYYRLHNHIMRHTDLLREIRETNNSLLTTKEGETMRVLTLMALLTFPLALFVAIFDIDAVHNPIKGLPYDFWIIVGIVVTAGVGMVWYFRHKGWL